MAQDDAPAQPPPPAGPMMPRRLIKRVMTPIVAVAATLYFVVDALFYWLVKPIANLLGRLAMMARVRAWIQSLGPYPTLVLFLVPVIILEPVKPVAFYLMGTGHFMSGTLVLVVGEILKITIVERLFQLGRDKLMTIRAFAWAYNVVMGWLAFLQSLPPWQAALRRFRTIKARARLAGAAIKRMAGDIRRRWSAYWADPA
jgi:hypothetical protein